jgi:Tfp pilus assembly protein PilO
MTKERKIILVIGFAALLAGVVYRFGPQIVDAALPEASENLREKQALLQRYRLIAERKASLEARITAMEKEIAAVESGLFSGETKALATVEMQNQISRMAAESGAEIRTVREITTNRPAVGSYEPLQLEVKARFTIDQLTDFLYRVESSSKRLTIPHLSLRADRRGRKEGVHVLIRPEGYRKRKAGEQTPEARETK